MKRFLIIIATTLCLTIALGACGTSSADKGASKEAIVDNFLKTFEEAEGSSVNDEERKQLDCWVDGFYDDISKDTRDILASSDFSKGNISDENISKKEQDFVEDALTKCVG